MFYWLPVENGVQRTVGLHREASRSARANRILSAKSRAGRIELLRANERVNFRDEQRK